MNQGIEEHAAHRAARMSGLRSNQMIKLHQHATAVFLLPTERIVARVSPVEHLSRLTTSVTLTRWLTNSGVPATEPADLEQPVLAEGHVVTFWRHYPQPTPKSTPNAEHLGRLLRQLHQLPQPPITLPKWTPLTSFTQTLAHANSVPDTQKDWLATRAHELIATFEELDYALTPGLVHGDAYPGNCLWDGDHALLGDWDEAAVGPREVDLANTYQGQRFGRTAAELETFGRAYGYDITSWPGLPMLIRIRDMHTLSSYIRRADMGNAAAAHELGRRIATLQRDDTAAIWKAA
ncbi:aminoglycoside phosphotransferase family protein [Streptomyces sp. NPDC056930]|uniref:aminoglycoside phosphotransferase family protein n=1 Tax=Streptomyces sp. NPDC056930 TaxID=3345967 RepID=UPI00363FD4C9